MYGVIGTFFRGHFPHFTTALNTPSKRVWIFIVRDANNEQKVTMANGLV